MGCTTLTIQPDGAAGKDTYLMASLPVSNHGTETQIIATDKGDTVRGLLQYDLTAFSDARLITNATLRLWADSPVGDGVLAICRVTRTNWVETEATWNKFSLLLGNWTTAGGDFTTTSKATASWADGEPYKDFDITALVKDAITNRSGLLSLMMKCDDESAAPAGEQEFTVKSSDHATASERPRLHITSLPLSDVPTGLSSYSTLGFNSDAGFTYDDDEVEIEDEHAGLVDAFEGNSTLITPSITLSGSVNRVIACQTEEVGYYHRFLCSFDDGNTWRRFTSGGWKQTKLTDINRYGNSVHELDRVRSFPSSEKITFAINITRETDGGTGSLNFLTVIYGSVVTELYTSTEDPDELPLAPSFPYSMGIEGYVKSIRTDSGHDLSISTNHLPRRTFDIEFRLVGSDKDTIVDFLTGHLDVPFLWTPVGFDDPLRFIASEPSVEAADLDAFIIKNKFTQVFEREA